MKHCIRAYSQRHRVGVSTRDGNTDRPHGSPWRHASRSDLLLALAAAATLGGLGSARADVVVSYAEVPGQESSLLTGTSVFNFNSLATGTTNNLSWSGVGTYDKVYVHAADVYGGAGGNTNYALPGTGVGAHTTNLTLTTSDAYFGLWWSAGDANNVLDFYNGSTLVAHFTTSTLLARLPATYNGNPDAPYKGQNAEPYAFLNFFATGTTTWNKIVISNTSSGSGFESDNHTIRVTGWNPATDGRYPGVAFETVNGSTTTALGAANAITSPVNLGNIRVGGSFTSQALTLQNTAPSGSMALDATIGGATGTANTTGSSSITGLAAGATNSTSFKVGLDGSGSAGARTGTVTVSPSSDGIALAPQTVTINGGVYRLASGTVSTPAYVGKVHIGGAFTAQPLTVQNTAVNDIYSEKLDASLSAPSGNVWTNSGTISQLAPAGSNSSALSVNLTDTATAGHKTGTASVAMVSNGTGTSGLANYSLGSQNVDISGDVYRYASASHTPDPVNLGNVHVGGAFTAQAITVQNTATNDGYSESLDATISPGTGVSASGSFSQLAPQSSSSNLTVSLTDTATAGPKTGTATIGLVSDGTGTSGLGNTTLTSQSVTINGAVYTGKSTWTPTTGGSWGGNPQLSATHANWSTNDGAPGTWGVSFDNVDTATFGNTLTAASTVTVDSAVSVKSITFANDNVAKGTYTIASGTGSLTMKSSDGTATLSDTSGRSTNAITASINLQSNLAASVKTGGTLTVASLVQGAGTPSVTMSKTAGDTGSGGTLLLTGTSNYTGTTTVSSGTLQIGDAAHTTASLGNTAVTVAHGATLDGVKGTVGTVGGVGASITVSGTIAPGNGTIGSISTLTTTGAETWASGGAYAVDISKAIAGSTPSTTPGTDQDCLVMKTLTLASGFTVQPNTGGAVPTGFAPNATTNSIYEWVIGQVTGGTINGSLSSVSLNTSLFNTGSYPSQPYHFSLFSMADAGGGGVQDVVLKYDYNAVPEATTLLLGMAGLTPLLLQRRRQRLAAPQAA